MGGFCSVTILMDHGRCFPHHSACVLPRACHLFSSAMLTCRDFKQVSRGMGTWTTRLHKGGLPHAVQSAEEVASPDLAPIGPQAKNSPTGMLSGLPMVPPAAEHIATALKRAERVKPNLKLKNELQRVRNQATRRMDTLAKEVSVPLGAIVRGFPPREQMHPFEQALVLLTIGPEAYERRLVQVDALRRSTLEVGKSYAAQVAKAQSKKEVLATVDEGIAKVVSVYNKGARAVDDLKDMVKALRRLPVVDPVLPTVALVGAPNVGKSSLVQVLSSGVPEICNYPFTTRSIKMGHFFVDGRRHQVTDTPGLLARADEDRNAMENLTLACLAHLPTSVLFVMDLTGECGTSLENQWAIRQYLKERFPNKPWLDVFSKGDLVMPAGPPQQQAGAQAESDQGVLIPAKSHASDSSHNRADSLDGQGEHAEHFNSRDRPGATEQFMASGQSNPSFRDSREGGREPVAIHAERPSSAPARHRAAEELTGRAAEGDIPLSGADFLRLLPDAVVVSSTTRKGLDTLKERVLTMLGFPEWEV